MAGIASLLAEAARRWHSREAVVDGERVSTYADLARRAFALAAALEMRGLEVGDRVAVLAWNTLEFVEVYFAAAAAGLVLCPLNVRLAPPELAFVLDDAGARFLLADPDFVPTVERTKAAGAPLDDVLWFGAPYEAAIRGAKSRGPRIVAPDDAAHLYHTSGTTGRPKGVVLTHRNVGVHAEHAVRELVITERDVWGHIAPMFHLADAWATFAVTLVGGRHVMVPRFDATAVLDAIERHRITITNLVPTMLNLVVRHPTAGVRDLTSLRLVMSGGAPIAPEVVRAAVETLACEYVQTYGMTETSPYLTLGLLREHHRSLPAAERLRIQARTGRPFSAVDLEVVGEDGRPVPADDHTVGEIRVRGETVTPGYWRRPEETRAAFDAEGWLRTGDLAVVDAEGYVNIVDRRKDVILTGGETVYSVEVENALYAHPAVLEAAVVGLPDPVWGEVVGAGVVLRAGACATEAEILAFVREQLAAYKTPKTLVFLEALPRTGSGKVAKRELRRSRLGRAAEGRSAMSGREIARETFERHLASNPYPGRGLVVGRRSDAPGWMLVYFIMGRSENSRNRRFASEGDRLWTEPVDASKVEDPSLIMYDAMLALPGVQLVSNGDQTRTVYDALVADGRFPSALATREREPDAPNFTPRITAMLDCRRKAGRVELAILKANRVDPAHTDRVIFRPADAAPGLGYGLTTYMGDGSPLPSFEGDPLLLPLEGSAAEVLEAYWGALDDANRISLAVKSVGEDGALAELLIRNRHDR